MGRLPLSRGRLDAGIEALKKAVARNGSHGEARHALAQAFLQQGKPAEARDQLEAWQRDNPGSAAAHLALADLLVRSDADLDRARREYEAFLKSGGDPADQARVKRTLSTLKKKLAKR